MAPARLPSAAAKPDGIVLAGGPGRRFGRPKAEVLLGGRSLVARAVEALLPHCRNVVVVTRPKVRLPALPCRIVMDRPGAGAPLVGVATGLAVSNAPECVVLACDLPFAVGLLDAFAEYPRGRAIVGADGERVQPLCGRYPRTTTLAAAERLLAQGTLVARALLDEVEAIVVEAAPPALLNVNTTADLARAEAIVASISRGRA